MRHAIRGLLSGFGGGDMKRYTVSWDFDIYAKNPKEAAQEAHEMRIHVPVYKVRNNDDKYIVDLTTGEEISI